jgi:Lecithin:cholesterol acyltransferase
MSSRNYLVVVLPGIGGSVLAPPAALDRPVWQASLPNVPNVLRDPDRLSIGEHEHLVPVGVIKSRKAFGVWTVIPGYHGLMTRLSALPGARLDDGSPANHALDANVVAVPYDFRRSIVEAAQRLDDEIRQRLPVLWPADDAVDPTPRVVFVTHSMGGLVARYWAAQHDNERRCRALISLGTPHRGAPKALDVLANGVPVRGFRIRRPINVLREWPGLAELLPRYPAVVDATRNASRPVLRPHELPLDWLRKSAGAAYQVHQQIDEVWAGLSRSGPDMQARIGFGHGTLRRCVWDGAAIRVTDQRPGIADLGGWDADAGDGTVPAFSGLPPEQDFASAWNLRVNLRHGPIADLDEVIDLVESYENYRPPRAYHGKQRTVALGLELDEVTLAGEDFDVRARVVGIDTDTDLTKVPIWASMNDGHTRLEWDTGTESFVGRLPGPPVGVHEVSVSAQAVPGGGDLDTQQLVEVIDDDGLD